MADGYAKQVVTKAGMAVAGAAVMGVLVYAGQTAPAAKSEDVLPALLVEVKGLRAAMERMASAGPRVQLFVSRLQLQEGRIDGMIRRLDTLRATLGTARDEMEVAQQKVTRLETQLASGVSNLERDELTAVLTHTKREMADRKVTAARLSAEEAQLTQDLTVEQGRWTEISQRLDELERALAGR
jgi:hypothetical protein